MTSIPLSMSTVCSYLGTSGGGYNGCQDISKIHLRSNGDGTATVEGRIPASTSNQRDYTIVVTINESGNRILRTSCTCPVGYKCKHIYKVLCRIVKSSTSRSASTDPLPAPSKRNQEELLRKERQAKQFKRGAYVYLAMTSQSEFDSGSDYGQSRYYKSNFDQKILGIFFSLKRANECAKDYLVEELVHEIDDDDDDTDDAEDDDDVEEDDEEEFVWDGSDHGEFFDGVTFDKVWVECRPIEDASSRFHN